jgi:hypothetical protein
VLVIKRAKTSEETSFPNLIPLVLMVMACPLINFCGKIFYVENCDAINESDAIIRS